MGRERNRRAWLWLLPIAVAAVTWALLDSDGRPPSGGAVEHGHGPEAPGALDPLREPDEAAPRLRAEPPRLEGAPRAPRGEPTEVPEADPATPSAARAAGPPAGAAGVLTVLLDLPRAWREATGEVYALPAGGPGANQPERVPHRGTRDPDCDRIVLPLPKTGLWDVGFRCNLGHTLVHDVPVPETAEVVLRADGAAPVTLRVAGGTDRSLAFAPGTAVRLVAPDDAPTLTYPGRGQRTPVRARPKLDESGAARTAPMPPGLPFEVHCHTLTMRQLDPKRREPVYGLRPERPVVFAGEEVVLRAVRLGLVRLHLSLGAPVPKAWREKWNGDLWTAVQAMPVGGGQSYFASTYLKKDGTLKQERLALAMPPGSWRLEIGIGLAYVTQVETLDVVAGEACDVEARLVPNPEFLFGRGIQPSHEDYGTRTVLRVEGGWTGRLHVVAPVRMEDGEIDVQRHSFGPSSDPPPEIWARERFARAQALLYPDRASAPFEMPRRGEVGIRLRPAGLLMVVPEVEPDESLGQLRLRRPDGAPIAWSEPDDRGDLDAALEVEAVAGRIVGPLLAGEHRFEILLGGVVVGEAKARVRAGRMTPLAVTWPGAAQPR